jgi:P-type E1-E2 ATPase
VLLVNTAIGLVQEIRAKRELDRLSIVTEQRSRVVRAGVSQELPSSEIVLDDVVELRSRDQVPVDGDVIRSAALEIDESLVTGEAAPVVKAGVVILEPGVWLRCALITAARIVVLEVAVRVVGGIHSDLARRHANR